MDRKILTTVILIASSVAIVLYLANTYLVPFMFAPRTNQNDNNINYPNALVLNDYVEIIAQDITIPWEIIPLQAGDILVSERPGTIIIIGSETKTLAKIEGVNHVGEGGLLGMALHPDFPDNHFIYMYYTTKEGVDVINRVERYVYTNDSLHDKKIIIDGIKGATMHDGGRIAFGPDKKLYITTGDALDESLPQDTSSLNGKILRLNDDGSIPSDNPFGNAVYSYGHRNPEGIDWDENGVMWESEHGPSGINTGYDEINIIKKGGNYGWPMVKGDEKKEGVIPPIIQSGSQDTWAPSDLKVWKKHIFFTGLRGETLYELFPSTNDKPQLIKHFTKQFGRLRGLAISSDGSLLMSRNNGDGRGTKRPGDDKILKVNAKP